MSLRVVIVSSIRERWEKLSEIVSRYGLQPVRCETLAAALALLACTSFTLAICEDVLPDGGFQECIAQARLSRNRTPVVVVSRLDDWDSYLKAMGAGAFDYVALPPHPHELERVLAGALAEARSNRGTTAATAA